MPVSGLADDPFDLTEVADGLYVHHGVTVNVEHPQHDDIANIGFIVGEQCVAVIDTGGSAKIGHQLRSAIKRITPLPICYVINTHVHYDHVLGNIAFQQDKPQFIGHHKLADAISQNRGFFLDAFGPDLGPKPTSAMIIGPDKLVKQNLTLDLGNRTLLLTAHPSAHTNQDLTVYDRKTDTLWLADLLFIERIPYIDSSGQAKGWLKVLSKLNKRQVARVIPGHGPISAEWPKAAKDEQRYFDLLISEIRPIIAKGGYIEEALKTVGHSEKDNWLLFEDYNRRNVSHVFTELEWE